MFEDYLKERIRYYTEWQKVLLAIFAAASGGEISLLFMDGKVLLRFFIGLLGLIFLGLLAMIIWGLHLKTKDLLEDLKGVDHD